MFKANIKNVALFLAVSGLVVVIGVNDLLHPLLLLVFIFAVHNGLKTHKNSGSIFVANFAVVTIFVMKYITDLQSVPRQYSFLDGRTIPADYTGLENFLYAQLLLVAIYVLFLVRALVIQRDEKKSMSERNIKNRRKIERKLKRKTKVKDDITIVLDGQVLDK